MTKQEERALIESAVNALKRAYCPYSKFQVGAVLYCEDQESSFEFTGANVENASYGLTICAERVAIFNAIFSASSIFTEARLIIATNAEEPSPPCGACLQVMSEFFGPKFQIVSYACRSMKIKRWTLKDLLSEPFRPRLRSIVNHGLKASGLVRSEDVEEDGVRSPAGTSERTLP